MGTAEAGSGLVAAARDLAPTIRTYADEAEAGRRLPQPLVEAFIDARLFLMSVPREYGGEELDFIESMRVMEELAIADGSAAWNVMIGSGNGRAAASLPEETGAEIFGDPRVVCAAALPIGGEGVKVDGGYILTGRWPYCSGCQQSSWFMPGFLVKDGEHARRGPDGRIATLVGALPKSDWRIEDNWNTTGMRGTGSHDIVIEGAFVPERRTYGLVSLPRIARPLYRMAPFSTLGPGVGAVCLGIARHALDVYVELAQTKRHSVNNSLMREGALAQVRVSEAEVALQSGRAFFYEATGNIWAAAKEGRQVSIRERALLRMACVNAAQASVTAVDLVFGGAGSQAAQVSLPIERCWRDLHTAATHVTLNVSNYESTGRVLFGMEPGIALI
ncbi:MAG: acyl-CoA dehydrogenase family protein [Tepidiformaceae bacterium]